METEIALTHKSKPVTICAVSDKPIAIPETDTAMKRNVHRYRRLLWLVALLLSCRGGEVAFAADAAPPRTASAPSAVRFRPVTTGAPSVRVTGLSEHGAKLTPGVEYQWVVALVTDPNNRSSDLVASGVIKRVEPAADLKEKIAKATPASLPGVYAEAGIWYDALAVLSDQIEAQPENKSLRETRSDLLRQVGLKAAAGSEAALIKN